MIKENKEEIVEEFVEEEVVINNIKRRSMMNGRIFWGLILVFVGLMFFIQNYLGIEIWEMFWPFLIIFIGLLLIIKGRK